MPWQRQERSECVRFEKEEKAILNGMKPIRKKTERGRKIDEHHIVHRNYELLDNRVALQQQSGDLKNILHPVMRYTDFLI
jgi:hypothetical protein